MICLLEVFIATDLVGSRAEWDASFGMPAPLMDAEKIITLAAEGVSFGSHLAKAPSKRSAFKL